MNFLRMAKDTYETVQSVKQGIDSFREQQAANSTTTTSPELSSKSRSPSKERKREAKFETVNFKTMIRIDNDDCFSVMQDSHKLYHVIYVEASVGVCKTNDRANAEAQRNLFNQFRVVAKSAYQHKFLNKFIEEVNEHPTWPEVHLACFLNLEDAVNKICAEDPLVMVNCASPEDGILPLHVCIKSKNLSLSKKLLSLGADLRKCDLSTNNCLHYAVSNDLNFLKELYNTKPDQFKEALDSFNSDGHTPFHFSLKQNNPKMVEALINCGANSSLVNVDISGLDVNLSAFTELLKRNPNAMTGDPIIPYSTIFHEQFDRNLLKVAHQYNPKVIDHPNLDGRTPLHSACIRDDLEYAVYLLAFGANVNVAGKLGNTPLHLAINKGNEALVKLLLCFDADYNLKNRDGQSAVEMNSTAAIAKIFSEFTKNKKQAESEAGHDLPDLIKFKHNKTVNYQESLEENVREKSLRLLSLDGGGIRGLCLVLMLMRIERETKSKNIIDYFDWVAGTSTGAIFALSLLTGYSTIDCLRFYLRMKDDVFVGSRPHDSAPLESSLREIFGEKKMNEIKGNKRVLLTTTKADTNPPKLTLIRSYEMPELITLSIPPSKITMWKAARCSSAAPTYFTSVDKMYLDGGLIANNPAPDLISDIHHFNLQLEREGKEPFKTAILVSLGTGRLNDQKVASIDLEGTTDLSFGNVFSKATSAFMTIKNLSGLFMEQLATSDGAVIERCRSWAHSLQIPFFRYTPQLLTECPLNTKDDLNVVNLMWTAKLYAESRSNEEIQQIIRLLRAY